jgi:hypothetical protein
MKTTGSNLATELARQGVTAPVEKNVASAIAALTVALFFLLLWRRTRSLLLSTVLALLFAFGTSVLSTTSRALFMQGPALLVIVVVMNLLWEMDHPRKGGPRWLPRGRQVVPFLGPLVVLAYATRPTTILLAVVVFVYVGIRSRHCLIVLCTTTALSVTGYFLINMALSGRLQQPYYSTSMHVSLTTIDAVGANLVSPGRGLIVWTPAVLFAACAVAPQARRRRLSLLDGLLVGWCVVHLVVVSSIHYNWWGGWSVGPRFMADVLPALFFLMCPALAWLPVLGGGDLRRLIHAAALGVFVVAAGWGLFVNVRSSWRESVVLWNRSPVNIDLDSGRVWSWSDPQFLR